MKKATKICLKSISILSAILILVASFSLFSFADTGTVYTMPLNQPSTDPGRGYIQYLVKAPNGTITPVTLFWKLLPGDDSLNLLDSRVHFEVVNNNTLLITPGFSSSSSTDYSLYYCAVYGDGTTNYYFRDFSSGSLYITISLATGYTYVGFQGYGNVGEIKLTNTTFSNQDFSFLYSENAPEYELLLDLHSDLNRLHTDLTSIKNIIQNSINADDSSTLLTSINSYLKSIDSTLDILDENVVDIENAVRTINQNVLFILQNVDDVEEELRKISGFVDGIEGYIDNLEGYVDGVEGYLKSILSSVDDIEDYLLTLISDVDDLEDYTDDLEDLVQEIIDILNSGEEAPPPPAVDSDDAEDQMNQMDDFVSGSGSQDVQGNIDNAFDSDNLNAGLDTDTSGFLWDVLDLVLDTSPEVFGMLISLLSYGLISLLLGR